jgi:hypothetical protein
MGKLKGISLDDIPHQNRDNQFPKAFFSCCLFFGEGKGVVRAEYSNCLVSFVSYAGPNEHLVFMML